MRQKRLLNPRLTVSAAVCPSIVGAIQTLAKTEGSVSAVIERLLRKALDSEPDPAVVRIIASPNPVSPLKREFQEPEFPEPYNTF